MEFPRLSHRVLFVSPLPEEMAALRSRATVARESRHGGCRLTECAISGHPALLAVTGDGRDRAAAGLRAALACWPDAVVAVLGVAGGLSPGLRPGTLIVAENLYDDREALPGPNRALVQRALGCSGVRAGTVVSVRRVLATASEKRRVLGAHAEPAVVDIESATLAREAAAAGAEILVARVVSDGAEEALPFDPAACSDADGRVRRGAVVRQALLRPGRIGEMLRLRRRVAEASHRLADFAVEWLIAGRGRRE